ncbi:adenylosuccinate lyase [Lasius niger]|uniref:Adenylosuccinate lyase n=1 Tax=Lasius niger TaxID=67767 RepID=A0A0J7N6B1_LASNI|nr:adenylosuccinate lyase [Lasius niger]
MIPRYIRPEMSKIWSDTSRFKIWFEIEALVCEAMAEEGRIPKEAALEIRQKGQKAIDQFSDEDLKEIAEIERETRHDVIAFLTWLARRVGENGRFVHLGLTSSDILDTCLSVQLTKATDLLLEDLDQLLAALHVRAEEHKYTKIMGRSHAVHAEPTTFGIKLAGYYAEFKRNKKRLEQAREEIAVCAISGAVGTYAHIGTKIEKEVAKNLHLTPETVSTQIIPRDRHAAFFSTLGVVASSVERLAVEIRHLQRSEVSEAEEFFHKGQKGSSAMPHKRNPVLSENLTGLARLVRSAVTPALENVILWHERDISHSSVERNICPDATEGLDFALVRLASVVKNLQVYPDKMLSNLESQGGLYHSGQALLALAESGLSREDAYKIVQEAAMQTWNGLKQAQTPDEIQANRFETRLKKHPDLQSAERQKALEKVFASEAHYHAVDEIFSRLFEA